MKKSVTATDLKKAHILMEQGKIGLFFVDDEKLEAIEKRIEAVEKKINTHNNALKKVRGAVKRILDRKSESHRPGVMEEGK